MKTSELLKAAKAKIADEKCWTQGADARDLEGNSVDIGSARAVCYCSVGVLIKLIPVVTTDSQRKAWEVMSKVHDGGYIAVYNDSHTHAEVMAKWDEAIKLAEDDND